MTTDIIWTGSINDINKINDLIGFVSIVANIFCAIDPRF